MKNVRRISAKRRLLWVLPAAGLYGCLIGHLEVDPSLDDDGSSGQSPGGKGQMSAGGEGASATSGGTAVEDGGSPAMPGDGGAPTSRAGGENGEGGGEPQAAGTGSGGTNPTGDGGAGGEPGQSGPPKCQAVVQRNGTALTLKATDISAFNYTDSGQPNILKMAYDPVSEMVVMLSQNGKLYQFDPHEALPNDNSTGQITNVAALDVDYVGTGDHRGLAFGPGDVMYVLANNSSGGKSVTIRKGVKSGTTRTWTDLVTSGTYPISGTNFDHSFSGIAVSPDGNSLFFSSGSRTDHGELVSGARELALTSAILKVPTNIVTNLANDDAALGPYRFADGTRNAFDMAFNAAGDLIAIDNGPDMDLPDEVNFIEQGKHYGFPWRFGAVDNPVRDAAYSSAGDTRVHVNYAATYAGDAAFPPPPAGGFVDPIVNNGPDANYQRVNRDAVNATKAGAGGLAGITAHRAPLGIAFDTEGALCGDYYEQGFLFSYGAVNDVMGDPGRDLLLLTLQKAAGKYTMNATVLATGLPNEIDSVLVDNRLFVTGFGSGNNHKVYVFELPTP